MTTNAVRTIMKTVPKLELAQAMRRAWVLFQESGVMREPTGRTGNDKIDELGALLDEYASGVPGQKEA